ncbi:MAG: PilZ domain-containing protein [Treponema sp.]|nr:PilZ domain-containing protein [Treponema sp.]
MSRNQRRDERYEYYGCVTSHKICSLPGRLEDISLSGCRVRFPIPVSMDMDNDYTVNIKLFNNESASTLPVLCHPEWNKQEDGQTEIGFSFLQSLNTHKLESYVRHLQESFNDKDDIYSLIIQTKPVFVYC